MIAYHVLLETRPMSGLAEASSMPSSPDTSRIAVDATR